MEKIVISGKDKKDERNSVYDLINWFDTQKVKAAKVMVVGAGALGNEVLKHFALLNIGNVLIVDFDTIELSNLSRSVLFRESDCGKGAYKAEVASERIKELNPKIATMVIKGDIISDIGLGVFRRMDAIVGCLDNRLARLYINRYAFKAGKMWVDGAIENLIGKLDVYEMGKGCYECQLTEPEIAIIRHRLGCADIANRYYSAGRIPTTSISSSIIGAMQAQEALKIIHGFTKNYRSGLQFHYDGMNNMTADVPFGDIKDECESHFIYDPVHEATELSQGSTIAEVMDWVKTKLNIAKPVIKLDHEVVLEISTEKSNRTIPVFKPKFRFTQAEIESYQEVEDEKVLFSKVIKRIEDDFPFMQASLKEIGIPALHILYVLDNENHEIYFVETTGDIDFLSFK